MQYEPKFLGHHVRLPEYQAHSDIEVTLIIEYSTFSMEFKMAMLQSHEVARAFWP